MFARTALVSGLLSLVLPFSAMAATPSIVDVRLSGNLDTASIRLSDRLTQTSYVYVMIYPFSTGTLAGDVAVKYSSKNGRTLVMHGLRSSIAQYASLDPVLVVKFSLCTDDPMINPSSCASSVKKLVMY